MLPRIDGPSCDVFVSVLQPKATIRAFRLSMARGLFLPQILRSARSRRGPDHPHSERIASSYCHAKLMRTT